MADVKGLLSDPEFQKLDPAIQKSTLGKLDSEFSSLTDDQFNQFKSKLSTRHGATGSWGTRIGTPTSAEWDKMSGDERKSVAMGNISAQWENGVKPALDLWLAGEGAKGITSLAEGGIAAIRSGAARKFITNVAGKAVASIGGAVAARQGAKSLGAPEWAADLAAVAGGFAGGKAEGWLESVLGKDNFEKLAYGAYKEKYGREPSSSTEKLQARGEARKIANAAAREAKQPTAKETASTAQAGKDKAESDRLFAESKAASDRLKSRIPGASTDKERPSVGQYGAPPPKSPAPANPRSLPEGVNPPIPPSVREMKPSTPPPGPSKDLSRQPSLSPRREQTSDEIEFEKTPKKPSPKGALPSPKTPAPGATPPVDASKVKEAADMVRQFGATPESLKSAPQSQWDAIGKQLGHQVTDEFKQAVIEEITPKAKPSPASGIKDAAPKTPKPSPGGSKVESTMTPEARATRADEHATKLAKAIRKTLPADKIPALTNDAAWKVLEDQTGTEATPKVRAAAIEKARKLWSEGPRSAGDLQKRRAEYFASQNP